MTSEERDSLIERANRVATLKTAQVKWQNEWADRMGKLIAQSTLSYVLVLIFWSSLAGVAVGFLLGRLFS